MTIATLQSTCASAFQCGLRRSTNRALARPIIEFNRTIHLSHGRSLPITNQISNNTLTTADSNGMSEIITTRHTIHTSSTLYHQSKSKKDLFTPSPFERSSRINVSDKFTIHRDLKEPGNAYGMRRYLLLPRDDGKNGDERYDEKKIIASLNANRHILFGAQLHATSGNDDDHDDRITNYLAACGSLLDVAKEDASINGQQVQALATLNGLCAWVTECLDKDGEGSQVLMSLMHNEQPTTDAASDDKEKNKLPAGKHKKQKITDPSPHQFAIGGKKNRSNMLEAITAIATGIPRPNHSVVGAGTYRDGEKGWVALAREYSQLATNDDSVTLDASYVGRRGLEEVALYKSRDGELTKVEHLGHVEEGYLREAGGAMARIFFV